MNTNPIHTKIIIPCILLVSVCLLSCGKQPDAALLTQSTWKFDQITASSSDPDVVSVLDRNKDFLKGQEIKFNMDSTFTSTFPIGSTAGRNEGGDWILDKDEPILTLYTYEAKSAWSIETLDENTLEIKRTDPSLKVDFYYRYLKK